MKTMQAVLDIGPVAHGRKPGVCPGKRTAVRRRPAPDYRGCIMAAVRELLSLSRPGVNTDDEPGKSELLLLVNSQMIQSVLDSGGIAKTYSDHGWIKGICLIGPASPSRVSLAASSLAASSPACVCKQNTGKAQELKSSTEAGRLYFTVHTLLAEGDERDVTRIKIDLLREALLDLSGVRGQITALMPRSDRTSIRALKSCGFVFAAFEPGSKPDRIGDERRWEELLQLLGCTLNSQSPAADLQPSGKSPTAVMWKELAAG
jgi:hypothetical protein